MTRPARAQQPAGAIVAKTLSAIGHAGCDVSCFVSTSRIGDYGVLGDGRSAALVSRGGSIDWLCWPRFDSDAVFAAILDPLRGGSFAIRPTAPHRVRRRYLPGTNVLETTFTTDAGEVTLTDLLAVSPRGARTLTPEHELVREVACTRGEVELEVLFDPRPGFAREEPRWRDAGKLGVRIEHRGGVFVARSDLGALRPGEPLRVLMRAGERRQASLVHAEEGPAVLRPLGARTREVIEETCSVWRAWSARCRYDGPHRDSIVRSALALKLLAYSPSGAVIAAPTTSLPERMGGDLNWDYRFCWLRDASLTCRALFGLGYDEEALAWASWLLHATRLTQPELRVLYDVYGERPRDEDTLDHLSGFDGSRPVRIGNAAEDQLQLDIYGEVIDTAAQIVKEGYHLDRESERMLEGLVRFVARNWRRPDEGIWEPRAGRAPHTHSRLLSWVALDRAVDLSRRGHLRHLRRADLEKARDAVRAELLATAWSPDVGAYVRAAGARDLDASTLLMACYDFEPPSSERLRRTYERIREQLGAGPGLLYRYRGPDTLGEGAFLVCSFWALDYLALGGGTLDEARCLFDELEGYANDLGLFSEEVDPKTGEPLGNFPQGFSHIGHVNAALQLLRREERERARRAA